VGTRMPVGGGRNAPQEADQHDVVFKDGVVIRADP